jgi:hypothetical protein
MRKILWSTAAAAIVVSMVPFVGSVQPSEATIIYPWCAHYGGKGGGAPSCGSSTYAQCMATLSGMQGFCDKNPWWVDPPANAARQSKRHLPG